MRKKTHFENEKNRLEHFLARVGAKVEAAAAAAAAAAATAATTVTTTAATTAMTAAATTATTTAATTATMVAATTAMTVAATAAVRVYRLFYFFIQRRRRHWEKSNKCEWSCFHSIPDFFPLFYRAENNSESDFKCSNFFFNLASRLRKLFQKKKKNLL